MNRVGMRYYGAQHTHTGPVVRHEFTFSYTRCPHVLRAIPIICLNCRQHFVAFYFGGPHGGGRVIGQIPEGLVSEITWFECDPEDCECGECPTAVWRPETE